VKIPAFPENGGGEEAFPHPLSVCPDRQANPPGLLDGIRMHISSKICQPLTGNGNPYIIPAASDYYGLISFQEDHTRPSGKFKKEKTI